MSDNETPPGDGYLAEMVEARLIGQEITDQIDTILLALKSQIVSLHNASTQPGTHLDERIAAADAICRLSATYHRVLTI